MVGTPITVGDKMGTFDPNSDYINSAINAHNNRNIISVPSYQVPLYKMHGYKVVPQNEANIYINR